MFAEFWMLDDIHRWLYSLAWLGLVCLVVLLVWFCYRYWLHRHISLVSLAPVVPIALNHQEHHRNQSEEVSWMSTRRLSLPTPATSRPPLHSRLGLATPRLHLPQRASTSGVTAPMRYPAADHTRDLWEEVPTRPASFTPLAGPAGPADRSHRTAPLSPVNSLMSPSAVQPLRVGVVWHPGLARSTQPNEDSLGMFQGTCIYQDELLPFALFIVADGMGGHACGLEASRLAVQHMSHTVLQSIMTGSEVSNDFFLDRLIDGVECANRVICQKAQSEGIEMGTTLTAALIIQKKAYIVNVGDSRTYLFRDSAGLIQITHDHSLVASLVAYGDITPDEVYTHPERNKVYRSLGHEENVKVDSFCIDVLNHDSLLLCSDGLWEMVRDPAMEHVMRSSQNPTLLCERLLQSALNGGGEDNISAVLVQV